MSPVPKWILLKNDIYIPHWLDSMYGAEARAIPEGDIYIPHWLDSMSNLWCILLFHR